MFPEVTEQILDIFHQTETDNGQVWKDYKSSLCALQDLMDRLPDEQYQIIDEYIWAFFDLHMEMMAIALRTKENK